MYTAMNPTPLRGIAISMLAATLVACLSLPPYTVTFPALRGELDPLPVELLDETGLAVGLEIGELDGFPGDRQTSVQSLAFRTPSRSTGWVGCATRGRR